MKLKLLSLAVIALLFSSCRSAYHLRQGNRLFDEMAYTNAIEEYQKGLMRMTNVPAQIKLAESYRLTNNTEKAEAEYAKIVELKEAQPIHKLRYAKLLMKNGKYADAKLRLENYLQENPDDKAAKDLLASCDMIGQMKKDSSWYTVEPLKINTGESNFSPISYKDGIVFVSDRASKGKANKVYAWTGKLFLDLYYSKPDDKGGWSKPEALKGEVNGLYHDGPANFGTDSVMYVTRDNYIKKKTKEGTDDMVNLKIYETRRTNDSWNNLKEFPFNSNDYSTGHPSLTKDGNTMYFTSDMPGGMGGTDIWITKKINGTWTTPVNAGAKINTAENEMFPTVYHDTALYFSSEGHINLGGLDIFRSSITPAETGAPTFGEPVNLGYPINTSYDEFGMLMNEQGNGGYLSSNRTNSMVDQIYSFTMRDLKFTVDGIVVEKDTDTPIEGATVDLLNKGTGKKEQVITGADGKFMFKLDLESDYSITGSKDEFFTNTEDVSTKGKTVSENMTVKLKLELERIVINKAIVMKNIYYDLDKSNIRPDAAADLDHLITVMNENPGIHIEIGSHTDSRADDKYNMLLSQRRAQAAVDYIVAHNISPGRIVAKGYGETKLVNQCKNGVKCSESEHQQNRRTEFKVTSIDKKKTS